MKNQPAKGINAFFTGSHTPIFLKVFMEFADSTALITTESILFEDHISHAFTYPDLLSHVITFANKIYRYPAADNLYVRIFHADSVSSFDSARFIITQADGMAKFVVDETYLSKSHINREEFPWIKSTLGEKFSITLPNRTPITPVQQPVQAEMFDVSVELNNNQPQIEEELPMTIPTESSAREVFTRMYENVIEPLILAQDEKITNMQNVINAQSEQLVNMTKAIQILTDLIKEKYVAPTTDIVVEPTPVVPVQPEVNLLAKALTDNNVDFMNMTGDEVINHIKANAGLYKDTLAAIMPEQKSDPDAIEKDKAFSIITNRLSAFNNINSDAVYLAMSSKVVTASEDAKALVDRIMVKFNNDYDKIAEFFREQLAKTQGITFEGTWKEAAFWTADTIEVTGDAWKTAWNIVGDIAQLLTSSIGSVGQAGTQVIAESINKAASRPEDDNINRIQNLLSPKATN